MTALVTLPAGEAGLEAFVRSVAHSLPPVDFGSTAAIRAMADALRGMQRQARPHPVWAVMEGADGHAVHEVATGLVVALVMPRQEANAALIARAPEMDALLSELLIGPVGPNLWSRIRACIDGDAR